MSIIGGLALAVIIVIGGVYAARAVVEGVAGAIGRKAPASARKKAGKAGGKARAVVIEPVRHIKARAMADVRAQHWLEKKQAARKRREARREDRRQNRPARNWRPRVPRVAINIPGVTDQGAQPKGSPAQPVRTPLTAVPAPAPVKPAMTTPATTGRPLAMPGLRNGSAPDHAAVNSRVAQFEPESDGDLIRFMQAEAAGMAGYASALEELADHLLNGIGLDPAATQGVTEFANAVTEAAAIMTKASARFQQVYQGVREDVSKGTVLPFKGRWITGESA